MKKLLTLTGDVKAIFKLQDVNLLLNIFWCFFRIWNELLPKNGNLTKTFLLGAFGTKTLGVYLTGKKVKTDNNKLTAIQEYLLCCNYFPSFEDFSILTRESNDFKLKIMDSLQIARDKPILNKADFSLPLELFWYSISGYHMMFYHIIWCPSVPLCVSSCRLFSFHYYVTSFVFYQKQNLRAFIVILSVTMQTVAFEANQK